MLISESNIKKIIKLRGKKKAKAHICQYACNEFEKKTSFTHQIRQTDYIYFFKY